MTVLTQPKMSFQQFSQWFNAEPIWHKMQIENVTCRDMGNAKKSIIGNRASIKDIYDLWYLPRLVHGS